MIQILGILDILSAGLFFTSSYSGIIPSLWMTIVGFYLLVKGAAFLIARDIASIIDVISAGIIFLSLAFTIPKAIVIIVSLFLLQKGVFSLLS